MANNLRLYRLKHNMTLSQLSGIITGSTKQHNVIFKHETGKITTAKAAFKYSEALNENVFDILGDDVLLILPKTQEEKDKLLKIVENLKVE